MVGRVGSGWYGWQWVVVGFNVALLMLLGFAIDEVYIWRPFGAVLPAGALGLRGVGWLEYSTLVG
jgi:hypothetical protein